MLASGVVDVTYGCQNGATARARWHDAPVVDLERIKAESVAYFRSLDEGATLRHHFRHADEDGGLWYFEAVPDRGELIAIKQAELSPVGRLHRYSWEHLEDEHGFLTDLALAPEGDPLEAIPAEEFHRVWIQGQGWTTTLGERRGVVPVTSMIGEMPSNSTARRPR